MITEDLIRQLEAIGKDASILIVHVPDSVGDYDEMTTMLGALRALTGLPVVALNEGWTLEGLNDEQLAELHLRRVAE